MTAPLAEAEAEPELLPAAPAATRFLPMVLEWEAEEPDEVDP